MKEQDLAAARRRNTIAGLVESMRAAQMAERNRKRPTRIWYKYPQIGVWKGGCK